MTPAQWREWIGKIQTFVKDCTAADNEPFVPILYGLDSVHGGNYILGSTLFPHNTGISATYNLTLGRKAGEITAKDTRLCGIPWVFSPVLDLGMQSLWPRLYESFGEDPLTTTEFGAGTIEGIQGSADGASLRKPNTAAACMKHFLGYGVPHNGKDRTDAWIPENYLRQYILPSFEAAIKSGARTLMVNSGSVNGVPIHASKTLLQGLLREELGFDGLVVTDWQDIEKLVGYHRLAADDKEAVLMAIEAGIDMSMVPSDLTFPKILLELVKEGSVTEERINESVRRILAVKYDLGLFDHPLGISDEDIARLDETVGSAEDWEVALDLARQSIAMLKNNPVNVAASSSNALRAKSAVAAPHDGPLLPLNWMQPSQTILVVGPAADSITALCGGWTFHWQGAQSDSEFFDASGHQIGSSIYHGLQKAFADKSVNVIHHRGVTWDEWQQKDLDEVAVLAKVASVIVLAVGEAPESESFGNIDDLTISESQLRLFDAIKGASQAPIVTVLVEARPRILGRIADGSTAIMMAYLPCAMGGQAVAEILSGKINPSGRLTITYPSKPNDLDVYFHHPWGTYSQGVTTPFHSPLFDFGAGFGFSNMVSRDLQVSVASPTSWKLSVQVTNYGPSAGFETVLLFVRQEFRQKVTPEDRLLRRFAKIFLTPGQRTEVTFEVSTEDFKYWTPEKELVLDKNSAFTAMISLESVRFTLENGVAKV
eukprot:GILI01001991.1.p1 GENE.GILI01001991.1~~GILI01001991.1.p1  ORF type:complete len:826 (+),score=277.42 GILI01001991.1:345-2480(+)